MEEKQEKKKRIPTLYEPQLSLHISGDGDEGEVPAKRVLIDLAKANAFGFVGEMGSGKTASLALTAGIALAYHLPVWLNFKLEFKLKRLDGSVEHLKAMPLDMTALYTFDKGLEGGLVGIDEFQNWAESTRYQSIRNELIAKIGMQLRKRTLSFGFTTQNPKWVDNRMRFQSKVIVKCTDFHEIFPAQFKEGEKFKWEIYRWRLVFDGYEFRQVPQLVGVKKVYGKLLWDIYNSYEIQDPLEAMAGVQLDLEKTVITNKKSPEEMVDPAVIQLINEMMASRDRWWANEFWASLGIYNNRDKGIISNILPTLGIGFGVSGGQKYFFNQQSKFGLGVGVGALP